MRPTTMLAAAAAVALLLAVPAYAETRAIELPAFTAVDISSGIDAVVKIGPTQSIEAEASDPRLLDDLQVKVEGRTLKAYFDWNIFDLLSFGSDRRITLHITAPALDTVDASAGSDINATGITGDRLSFNASSGADISASGVVAKAINLQASSGAGLDIAGTCDVAKANASSGSDLDASDLVCATVDANASSGSDLEVHATGAVKVNASSGSDVTVSGSPSDVEQESSSGGDIQVH
ncbi:DUF2807 domain-containing protein [Devosia sp. ZB163]|uniref:head GIN domain-containing protein n=1 Tax=Devosia sp. ZB163 TaxID=3025938 RepID=UPI0023613F42|nr:head GIN domain-containing protein [Devosia sp. ZB163]MDC9823477.1 DUF2807 domain-containing protein [Devosia sp. ZB163]